MAKHAKYYVVWKGVKPGVYNTWAECEAQVKGYTGALYKSYPTRKEAEEAFLNKPFATTKAGRPIPREKSRSSRGTIVKNSISVDAACSGNPGIMEYRGVKTGNGEEIFRMGPFQEGTNNIGEFLAIVHALALLNQNGDNSTPIYSDSKIAQGWVKKGKAGTKLTPNHKNKQLFGLIERAEQWLKTHRWTNPVLKWETESWGEIPADFGRK